MQGRAEAPVWSRETHRQASSEECREAQKYQYGAERHTGRQGGMQGGAEATVWTAAQRETQAGRQGGIRHFPTVFSQPTFAMVLLDATADATACQMLLHWQPAKEVCKQVLSSGQSSRETVAIVFWARSSGREETILFGAPKIWKQNCLCTKKKREPKYQKRNTGSAGQYPMRGSAAGVYEGLEH